MGSSRDGRGVSGAQGEKDVEGDMMQALVALNATQMMVGPGKWAHRCVFTGSHGHPIALDSNSIG